MTLIYAYEASYYDEFNEKNTTSRGFIVGESYEDAMANISRYYGGENLCSCTLTFINENGIVETPELFSEVVFNSLIEENSF